MDTKASQFVFDAYRFDSASKTISFEYEIVFVNGRKLTFAEKLYLPKSVTDYASIKLLERVAKNLHLILGISYYKLYCPKEIVIKTFDLSEKQAQFWNTVYTKGLGEFFFKNNINFKDLIKFPSENIKSPSIHFETGNSSLLGIGGGKDSVVAAELLKRHDAPFTGYYLETFERPKIITDVASLMGIDILYVKRELDRKVYEPAHMLNDAYKGHVPISAIYAFIGVLVSVLTHSTYIVAANEASADEGNVDFNGAQINHQWSKSTEFEQLFNAYVHEFITSDIVYLSILRAFSELAVIKQFSKYPKYFSVFSSCNVNFKNDLSLITQRWCGNCPKCAFVFISLAAFIDKETVVSIFNKNLLEDELLMPIYRQLLGIEGIKPFECVGTPKEVEVAFYLAHKKGEFDNTVIMKMFIGKVLPGIKDIDERVKEVFKKNKTKNIPKEFDQVIERMLHYET